MMPHQHWIHAIQTMNEWKNQKNSGAVSSPTCPENSKQFAVHNIPDMKQWFGHHNLITEDGIPQKWEPTNHCRDRCKVAGVRVVFSSDEFLLTLNLN